MQEPPDIPDDEIKELMLWAGAIFFSAGPDRPIVQAACDYAAIRAGVDPSLVRIGAMMANDPGQIGCAGRWFWHYLNECRKHGQPPKS